MSNNEHDINEGDTFFIKTSRNTQGVLKVVRPSNDLYDEYWCTDLDETIGEWLYSGRYIRSNLQNT